MKTTAAQSSLFAMTVLVAGVVLVLYAMQQPATRRRKASMISLTPVLTRDTVKNNLSSTSDNATLTGQMGTPYLIPYICNQSCNFVFFFFNSVMCSYISESINSI